MEIKLLAEDEVSEFLKTHSDYELLTHSRNVIKVRSLDELLGSIEEGYAKNEKDQSLPLRAMTDAEGNVPGGLALADASEVVDIGLNIRQDRQRPVKEKLLSSPAAKKLV